MYHYPQMIISQPCFQTKLADVEWSWCTSCWTSSPLCYLQVTPWTTSFNKFLYNATFPRLNRCSLIKVIRTKCHFSMHINLTHGCHLVYKVTKAIRALGSCQTIVSRLSLWPTLFFFSRAFWPSPGNDRKTSLIFKSLFSIYFAIFLSNF